MQFYKPLNQQCVWSVVIFILCQRHQIMIFKVTLRILIESLMFSSKFYLEAEAKPMKSRVRGAFEL